MLHNSFRHVSNQDTVESADDRPAFQPVDRAKAIAQARGQHLGIGSSRHAGKISSRPHSGCCQAFCLEQAHAFHHCSDMAVLEGHDLRANGKSAHGIRKRLPTRCRYEEITIAE